MAGLAGVRHLFDGIDPVDARLQMERDRQFLVPGRVAHDDLLLGHLLAEHRRERDPVIERVGLVGEQRDAAGRVRLAQLFGGGRAGESVAHDDVLAFAHSPQQLPKVPPRRWGRGPGSWKKRLAMEVRLVQLLGSFITTSSAYTLARLEFAMRHPESSAPPLIRRLSDASEATLRAEWEEVERQVDSARRYVREQDDSRGKRAVYDPSFGWLQRTTRELEQYARAVRWVLTVNDGRPGDIS